MTKTDASDARMAAHEMCRYAAEVYRAGKVEEAAAIYARVAAEFGASTDGYLRELVVSSIGDRASIRLGNPEIAARTEPTPDLVV